jgi:hypothetical protein
MLRELGVLDARGDDRPLRLRALGAPFEHGNDEGEDGAQAGEQAEESHRAGERRMSLHRRRA